MINDIELREIQSQLASRFKHEATQLYRLAWRMEAHHCKRENIDKCREEARFLDGSFFYIISMIYGSFASFTYAFKCNRIPWKCKEVSIMAYEYDE